MPAKPHFVVTKHGRDVFHYAVEFEYTLHRADGGRRYPVPLEAFEISEEVARLPLDTLIAMYKAGVRPKPVKPVKPRNLLEMG